MQKLKFYLEPQALNIFKSIQAKPQKKLNKKLLKI